MEGSFSGGIFYSISPSVNFSKPFLNLQVSSLHISHCHYIAIFPFARVFSGLCSISLLLISSFVFAASSWGVYHNPPSIYSHLTLHQPPLALSNCIAIQHIESYTTLTAWSLSPAQASWALKATNFHHTLRTRMLPTHPSYTLTRKSLRNHTKSPSPNVSATSLGPGTPSQ
jgi:hypothetical protein